MADQEEANLPIEVVDIGKLRVSHKVATEMCEDPDQHEGFLATWHWERLPTCINEPWILISVPDRMPQ
jgi:hypothetical protein